MKELKSYFQQEDEKAKYDRRERNNQNTIQDNILAWMFLGLVNEEYIKKGWYSSLLTRNQLEKAVHLKLSTIECLYDSINQLQLNNTQVKTLKWFETNVPEKQVMLEDIINECQHFSHEIIPFFSDDYPAILKSTDYPSPVLYCKGTKKIADLAKNRCIAIVGTRNPSWYGHVKSREIAKELAASGFTVVSGLARGIDTNSHVGAIAGKGNTVAVLGSGFQHLHPAENSELVNDIEKNGAVLSEHHPRVKGNRHYFVPRNRIISGLCQGSLIIEGSAKSGTRTQAKYTIDQGRLLFVLEQLDETRKTSELPLELLKQKNTYSNIYTVKTGKEIAAVVGKVI
ncbi:MAG: DNA-processing protein DprA [Candidatus Odinarchaeota archaeon]